MTPLPNPPRLRRGQLRLKLAPVVAVACVLAVALPAFGASSYRIDASTGASFVPGTANLFPSGADDAVVRVSTTAAAPFRLPFPSLDRSLQQASDESGEAFDKLDDYKLDEAFDEEAACKKYQDQFGG